MVVPLFFFVLVECFSPTDNIFLTGCTERCCFAGVPFGIYIAHKFHECLSLRDGFLSPTDCTDLKDFLFRFFATFKILFCLGIKTLFVIEFALLLRKNRSTDLHRFFSVLRPSGRTSRASLQGGIVYVNIFL